MRSKRTRLDRFLVAAGGLQPKEVRPVLARGGVRVDGRVATGISQVIDEFSRVVLDDRLLQARQPVYIMLHKPVGVVSATRDSTHKTVIDLLDLPGREALHIAGRLDYHSSGLLLLTNDGRWSRQLSSPRNNVRKLYRVTLAHPATPACVRAFAEGMYFAYEGITTRPAELRIVAGNVVEVALVEGRYRQIRRMFRRRQNRVLALHRTTIGTLPLDAGLAPGEYRDLTALEVAEILGQV